MMGFMGVITALWLLMGYWMFDTRNLVRSQVSETEGVVRRTSGLMVKEVSIRVFIEVLSQTGCKLLFSSQ